MVRFKWPFNKIQMQRVILLTIISMISYGILKDHMKYEKEVAEYMNSLEYRQAIEASNEHRQRLKSQQQLFCDNINGSSGEIETRVEDKIK
ncbi:uncharacterized protein LOC122529259 isoform X2 [Frieseomelitta varia]|nr:uncharacterized protein LOC122529259 isoform X2 [Frieseomelitta varia]